MLFNTPIFVFVYLPVVLGLYLAAIRLPWSRAGIAWLAAASLFFYGYWNPAFVPLLLASIGFNYSVGRLLAHPGPNAQNAPRPQALLSARVRGHILTLAVVANVLVLAWFKYANFLAGAAAAVAGAHAPVFDIALPLGISFYTFTQIAYIVDTHRSGQAERSVWAYTLFVTFFPHLVAGPVLHHAEMMPQFMRRLRNTVTFAVFLEGAAFFAAGLAKKVLIADCVAPAANRAFLLAEQHTLGWVDSWFGALAYTVQIYFDFSGYSDMAVGLALMVGIRLPFNFNSPYRCLSIIDFWRCWHMTLSRFLRDYLYIPLGGSRCSPARRQVNLMLTMLLGGLWHGASWNFVVWGGLHGLFLQLNHLWRATRNGPQPRSTATTVFRTAASWSLTFVSVVVAWVFFRAESFAAAGHVLQGMFLGTASVQADLLDARTASYVAIGMAIAVFCRNTQQVLGHWFASDISQLSPHKKAARFLRSELLGGTVAGVLLVAVALLTLISAAWGTHEFIYFNF